MKTSRYFALLIVSAAFVSSQLSAQQGPRRENAATPLRAAYRNAEFADAEELQRRESIPDAEGKFTRTRLLKTEMKYPFVRVQSKLVRNAATRAETTVSVESAVANQALVLLKPSADRSQVAQLAATVGAKVRKKLYGQNTYIFETDDTNLDTLPGLIKAIASHTNIVLSVDHNGVVYAALTPNDPRFGEQWGLNNLGGAGATTDADIDAPEAWDINTGGSSVVVAVIDTGVDFTHPDLAGASWVNTSEIAGNSQDDDGNGFIDDRSGWDFVNDDNDPTDDNHHGTHVAGILGARGNNGVGITGVAWHCRIMALKVLDNQGWGYSPGFECDLTEALNYARTEGAHIINMSLGGNSSNGSVQAALDDVEASGILVVCAAGNNGRDTDLTPTFPACYANNNIISVANSTDDDELASDSNFGEVTVDLAAPGTRILSRIHAVGS